LTDEVTVSELINKYMISMSVLENTSWVKHIVLNDGVNQYYGRLHWDSHSHGGYNCFWDGDIPPEADRPEFEFVLDCITELDK
jgi:hypothetical protein